MIVKNFMFNDDGSTKGTIPSEGDGGGVVPPPPPFIKKS